MSEESIQIVQNGTCANLSGNGKIKFNVGVGSEKNIYMQLQESSGGAILSKIFISLSDITSLLTSGEPITGRLFQERLYAGRSQSSGSALLSVLIHESLVQCVVQEDNRKRYESVDPAAYINSILELISDSSPQKKKGKSSPEASP